MYIVQFYTFYSNMFDSLEGNSFQVNQLEFLSNYKVVNLENKIKTMVLMSQLDNPILYDREHTAVSVSTASMSAPSRPSFTISTCTSSSLQLMISKLYRYLIRLSSA